MLLFYILILCLIVKTVNLFRKEKEVKKAIRLGIICLSILVINFTFMLTDISLIKNNRNPLFSITIARINDGGSILYCSLGYSLLKVSSLSSETKNNVEIIGHTKGYELRIASITVFEDTVFVPIEK